LEEEMKRILVLFLAFGLTFSLFAGGGSQPAGGSGGSGGGPAKVTGVDLSAFPALQAAKAAGQNITLTFWHNSASEAQAQYLPHQSAVADFAADFPNIKLDMEMLSETEYRYVLQSRLASGEYADCFIYWGTGGSFEYARNGYFLNLDSYITPSYLNSILPNALSAAYCDGSIYMIPYINSCSGLVVNNALFKKHGLKVPTTYNELLQNIKDWRTRGIVPFYIGGRENWTTMGLWDTLGMREVGATVADEAIKGFTSWNKPGFIEAARKAQELVDAGFFQDGFMGMTASECNTIFMQGNVPFNYTGSWNAGNFSDMEDVSVVLWPDHQKSGINPTEVFGGPSSGVFVNAKTKNPKIAAEFAIYYATQLSKYSIEQNKMPNTYKLNYDPAKLSPALRDFISLFTVASANLSYRDHMLGESRTAMYVEPIHKLFLKEITPANYVRDLDALKIYDVYKK
jgi:raffinose/stachyose/melibiose transport system substrate-binding protein